MQIPVEVSITRDPELEEKQRIAALVAEGVLLKATTDRDKARLDDIKDELAKLPAGKYFSEAGGKASVSAPGTTLKPDQDEISAARKLAGDDADLLFDREVVYKPKASFREIARAVLTPGRAKRIIALCEKPTSPQVRF